MKDNQFSIQGFLTWGISVLFFLYEFFLRTVIGTYQAPIMQDLNLNYLQFSLIGTTLFCLFYGIMQIPVGFIVENIGLKKSLLMGAILCIISTIGFAYAYSFEIAILYRVLMAIGASFGFICLLISIYDWMPYRYCAIFIGLSQFIGTLGPMIAAGPLDSISSSTGITWRVLFICLSIIAIAIMLLIILFVKNNQQKAGRYIILYKPEKFFSSILRLFARMEPWYIAILSACLYFTTEYLAENEGKLFLSLKGISSNLASYMITTAWIGYAIGCPLLGFISDIFQRRKNIMILCALLGMIAILAILYMTEKQYLLVAFFLLGISASGQSIGFATMAEQFKKKFVAIGFGLNNTIISIVSTMGATSIGFFLDYTKQEDANLLQNYLSVFNILIAIAIIALIIAVFFIKETYCKSVVDFTYIKLKKSTEFSNKN